MTVAPPYAAIDLVRVAVVTAIKLLSGAVTVHWLEAIEGFARPFIVVQSQDLGGRAEPKLGRLGWSGEITVKVLAVAVASANGNAAAAASALMATIAPAMDTLVAPTGYDLTVTWLRPLIVPPKDGVHQAGHIWRVYLEQE